MRAAWRARSTRRTPQVKGSSKERRSATLTPPSTIEARRTSCPPFSSASGGTERASNVGFAIAPSRSGSARRGLAVGRGGLPGRPLAGDRQAALDRAAARLAAADRLGEGRAQRRVALLD